MTLEEIEKLARDEKTGNAIELSVADLRTLAESNADHPAAVVYLKSGSIRVRPDEYSVFVDRHDVLGILENKEVVPEKVWKDIEESDGTKIRVPVIQKKLGKTIVKEPVSDDT